MSAVCQLAVKVLRGKSCNLNLLMTIPVTNTWCRSITSPRSEFYRKHSLETLAEKKSLLGLEDTPDVQETINIEESASEWKYVERLLPRLTVPVITNSEKCTTFSGWKPQAEVAPNLPYYVRRKRNQLLPVYFISRNGQQRHLTTVKYIEGDIWALEEDLRNYLQNKINKQIHTQVHELANYVVFKGDHVNNVKQWLFQQGF